MPVGTMDTLPCSVSMSSIAVRKALSGGRNVVYGKETHDPRCPSHYSVWYLPASWYLDMVSSFDELCRGLFGLL